MTPDKTTIVFGPPGTGKTTRLLTEVATYLDKGVVSEEIGFVSFTRKASDEARDRAAKRFSLTRKRLLNFRTLHSMAFGMLGLKRDTIMKDRHYYEIAQACGLQITRRETRMNVEEGLWVGATRGDKILFLENMARISQMPLDEVLGQSEFDNIEKLEVELWSRNLKSYKDANVLLDFTDMVTEWLHHGHVPLLKVLFVDEAQDLSKLQWEMVYKLAKQDCDVWIAGDDDQAIFKWAGAHPQTFTTLPGSRIVLEQSYRVPKVIHALAMELKTQIPDSVEKQYAPREEQGFLDFYGELEHVNMDEGKWLVLCRNNYLVTFVEETCRKLGYWYASEFDPPSRCTNPIVNWTRFLKGEVLTISELEEVLKMMGRTINIKKEYDKELFIKEEGRNEPSICRAIEELRPWYDCFQNMPVETRAYYRAVLARKERIYDWQEKKHQTPRIRISTIHGAKGGEEDNVVLLTDVSNKTYSKACLNWPDEYRVFYVAITRSKFSLHIIRPKTDKCLPLLAI